MDHRNGRKINTKPEDSFLISAIFDEAFCSQISALWNRYQFKSSHKQWIFESLLFHFEEYGKCPKDSFSVVIADSLHDLEQQDPEQCEEIRDYLKILNGRYSKGSIKRESTQVAVDRFLKYIDRKEIGEIRDIAESDLDLAGEKIKDWVPASSSVKSLSRITESDVKKQYTKTYKPLISLPGAIGGFLNKHMVQSGFVLFMAPQKSGKSYTLMNLGMMGVERGYKTLQIVIGDMTRDSSELRMDKYICKNGLLPEECKESMRPVYDCMTKRDRGEKKGDVSECPEDADVTDSQPVGKWSKEGAKEDPDYEPCSFCRNHEYHARKFKPALWWREAKDQTPLLQDFSKVEKLRNRWYKRHYENHAALYFQNQEISAKGLHNLLKYFARVEKFMPEIITLDYADNLKTPAGDKKYDAIGDEYAHLRNITIDPELGFPLLLSATQTNVKGLTAKSIHGGMIGGSNQKLNHPTAVFAIHRNDKTLRSSDCCIFQMDRVREGGFDARKILVGGHLDRGRVFGPSCNYVKNMIGEAPKEKEEK